MINSSTDTVEINLSKVDTIGVKISVKHLYRELPL